jgi:hypothetical protein
MAAMRDNEQDNCDNEPSLGSVGDMHLDQRQWTAGDRRDLELDAAESGIGDYDGLMEQVGTRDWQQEGRADESARRTDRRCGARAQSDGGQLRGSL